MTPALIVTLWPPEGQQGYLSPSGGCVYARSMAAQFSDPWQAEKAAFAAMQPGWFFTVEEFEQ